jgi:HemY protein
MIRFALYLLVVLAVGLALAWFADRPGEVALSWQGMRYETSLMVVVAGLTAALAAFVALWSSISALLRSPQLFARFLANRRRDRGYRALGQGLIAAGAGDTARARRMARDAHNLLGSDTLVEVLEAQTLLLEGNRAEARQRFQAMAEAEPTRLLGLRGLHLEAEREGNEEAALHYAGEAAKAAPSLAWAWEALLRHHAENGEYEAALTALEKLRSAGTLPRAEAERKRAVLMTGQAMRELAGAPQTALGLAKSALKLAPALVPASLTLAEAQRRGGDIRRAARTLEAAWKLFPHPDLADAYVAIDEEGTAAARQHRAARLAALVPEHVESHLAVAQAALSAREFPAAREALETAIRDGASRRAFLMMAELEDSESRDRGRSRDWLARAMRAAPDPAWVADGQVSQRWLPVSPASGRIDAFEWATPPHSPGRLPAEPLAVDAMPLAQDSGEDADAAATPKSAGAQEVDPGRLGRQPDDPGDAAAPDGKRGLGLF